LPKRYFCVEIDITDPFIDITDPFVEIEITDPAAYRINLVKGPRFMSEWGHANRVSMVAAIQSLARALADGRIAEEPEAIMPLSSAVRTW
jgi:hypothetical protein